MKVFQSRKIVSNLKMKTRGRMASKERKGMEGWMEEGRKGREGETKGLWEGERKDRREEEMPRKIKEREIQVLFNRFFFVHLFVFEIGILCMCCVCACVCVCYQQLNCCSAAQGQNTEKLPVVPKSTSDGK